MGTSEGGSIAINEKEKMFISPQPCIAFALATCSSSVNRGAIRGLCAGRINSLNSMPSGLGGGFTFRFGGLAIKRSVTSPIHKICTSGKVDKT